MAKRDLRYTRNIGIMAHIEVLLNSNKNNNKYATLFGKTNDIETTEDVEKTTNNDNNYTPVNYSMTQNNNAGNVTNRSGDTAYLDMIRKKYAQ